MLEGFGVDEENNTQVWSKRLGRNLRTKHLESHLSGLLEKLGYWKGDNSREESILHETGAIGV